MGLAVSYFTADAFNNVFEMCIWTILQCFVVDETQFSSNPFASGALSGCIKKTACETGRRVLRTTKERRGAALGEVLRVRRRRVRRPRRGRVAGAVGEVHRRRALGKRGGQDDGVGGREFGRRRRLRRV